MATSHDPHQQESSFWGCANVFIGSGFALCAFLAGFALFAGGLGVGWKGKVDPAAAAPAVTPTAPDSNTFSITLRPGGPTGMAFDTTSFNVKAGQKVKVTFENHNPTLPLQHNFVLGKIGSKERLVAASNAMMSDMAKWMAAGFIPESPDVIAHTRLLNAGETQTIEFTAPAEVGEYPYLCTFIGHATIMQGTMKVE